MATGAGWHFGFTPPAPTPAHGGHEVVAHSGEILDAGGVTRVFQVFVERQVDREGDDDRHRVEGEACDDPAPAVLAEPERRAWTRATTSRYARARCAPIHAPTSSGRGPGDR